MTHDIEDTCSNKYKLDHLQATNIKLGLCMQYKPVLLEILDKIKNENKYFGRDEYANSVIVESNNENLNGKIKSIKILNVNHNTLFGKIVHDSNQTNYAA